MRSVGERALRRCHPEGPGRRAARADGCAARPGVRVRFRMEWRPGWARGCFLPEAGGGAGEEGGRRARRGSAGRGSPPPPGCGGVCWVGVGDLRVVVRGGKFSIWRREPLVLCVVAASARSGPHLGAPPRGPGHPLAPRAPGFLLFPGPGSRRGRPALPGGGEEPRGRPRSRGVVGGVSVWGALGGGGGAGPAAEGPGPARPRTHPTSGPAARLPGEVSAALVGWGARPCGRGTCQTRRPAKP